MASNLEQILGRNIDSVKSLKTAIKELQDSMVGLDTDSQEYKDTASKLSAAQNALNATTKAGIEANLAAKDSIVGMQKEYNNLYDAYKKLSDEQRNSDIGKSMAESLNNLSESINNSKKEVGNFTSNIGHYAQGATEAFNQMGISVGALQGPFNLATKGAKGFKDMLSVISAHPIIAMLSVLIAILMKAASAIKDNEELTMRLHQAFSVFQPVLDMVSNGIDWLAEKIVKVVEGFGKLWEWLHRNNPEMSEQIKLNKDLSKAEDDLVKKTRAVNEENSKKQAEVERLREEAAATEDVLEKQSMLQEAAQIQAEIDQANIDLAKEDLRIKEERAKQTANDAKANEELAAAKKKVGDLTAEYSRHQKEFNEQLKATTNEIKTQTSAEKDKWEDEKAELKKFNDEYEDSLKTREQLVNEHYDRLLELAKNHNEDTINIEKARQKELNKIRLEGLSQQRQDADESIKLYEEYGDKQTAIGLQLKKLEGKKEGALTKIAALNNIVNAIYHGLADESKLDRTSMETLNATLDAAYEKSDKWRDFINENGFEALGDEYQPLKDAVAEVNAEFGLSIRTVTGLENAIAALELKILKLKGEWYNAKIEKETTKDAEAQLEGLIKTVTYDTYEGYQAYVEEQNRKALETEKTAIEEQLAIFQGTDQQKLEIMQRYYEVLAEMRQQDYEDEKAKQQALDELRELQKFRIDGMIESLIDMTDRMASSLSSYKSTRESVIDSEIKAGKISEEEGKRRKDRLLRLEKLERDFAIATIAADAASGIFKIWKGWATETGEINPASSHGNAIVLAGLNAASTLSAVAKSASLAATATAQIAAAKGKYIVAENNMIAGNGGGGGGVGATPALVSSTPYEYTRTIQTTEEEDRLNAPIIVRVSDILDGIETHNVQVTESTF